MKTIKATPITAENFLPYGYVANISDSSGSYGMGAYPCTFHRDLVLCPNGSSDPIAFGSLKIGKRAMIVQDVEYHSHACEVMMPMDDDIVIYVGPASSDVIELDKLVAFLVPKGTLVIFRAGVWHGAPYPVHHDGTVLICLPERTYLNDTKKYLLDEKDFLIIE
ncbi:ureidoglycolate lyase [Hydrogenoanaerobacterium sp.]|uniref:ureidoglycolate lyase n=1 Tax=Hydrogenoanaerobacterium sp. TaxID=2953763 RepID=UPI00289AC91C|nr:ureidoglycolate lyase [Hydrogenoanaerobacterium sp.]